MTKRNPESSRKASENRADHASIIEVSSASTQRLCSIEVIKLGVDTHAAQYTVARMTDHSGMQPTQSLSPQAFVQFLKKQRELARREVMVYEAGPYGSSLDIPKRSGVFESKTPDPFDSRPL